MTIIKYYNSNNKYYSESSVDISRGGGGYLLVSDYPPDKTPYVPYF